MASSCVKNDEVVIPLNMDAISYMGFNIGSWWVYEEVSTGEIDSMYVSYQNRRWTEDLTLYRDVDVRYETMGIGLESNLGSFAGIWSPEYYNYIDLPTNQIPYLYEEVNNASCCRGVFYIEHPTNAPTGLHSYYPDFLLPDSITINGITYQKTIRANYQTSLKGNLYKTRTFAKNVGCIQYELFDGRTFNLIKHNVVP